MRYLVIGGTSVIGAVLIEKLLSDEKTEYVQATKLSCEEGYEQDKLEWKSLDLRNVEDTNLIVKEAKADVIFDLASQESVGYSWKEPTETVDINVVGTINLLNAVRDYSKDSKLIIGGSGEEYGRVTFFDLPAKEETVPRPNNIYGATKVCQTMFAQLYHQAFGLDVVVVRLFYVTSVLQSDKYAISSFCKQFAEIEAGKREPILYTGNLNNTRDFTDVEDLAKALILVAEKGKSGEIYNAARGQATSLLEIVRILEKLTGIKVEIKMDAARVRPIDSPSMFADVRKIEVDTGWKAEISMEEIVEKMLGRWRDIV